MWAFIQGRLVSPGNIVWQFDEATESKVHDSPDGVAIAIGYLSIRDQPSRRESLKVLADAVRQSKEFNWIKPGDPTWTIDLASLRQFLPPTRKGLCEFLSGEIRIQPDAEITSEFVQYSGPWYTANIDFFITPELLARSDNMLPAPAAITTSLERFQKDYPSPQIAAFIMMGFGKTVAHDAIVKAIRDVLQQFGIAGLRADDKQYHDDLFPNVQTYLHGCRFGIAVFERIESEQFNPNVGLEVGYMLAMGKSVCYLKDKSLTTLQTDLIGKLYRTFDTYQPQETIPSELKAWLSDKGYVDLYADL